MSKLKNTDPNEIMERAIHYMELAKEIDDSNEVNWPLMEDLLKSAVEEVENVYFNSSELKSYRHTIISSYVDFCLEVANLHLTQAEIFSPEMAIIFFNKALKYRSDDPETLTDLGSAYATLHQRTEALNCWQKALRLIDPRDLSNVGLITVIEDNMQKISRDLE